MNYESFIALRYFRAKRKTGFISIITYISLMGVAIGVAALDCVLSAFNGFESEVRTRLINADSHVHLRKFYSHAIEDYQDLADEVRAVPGVSGASPMIVRESILSYKQTNQPIAVRALDQATADQVSAVPSSMVAGDFELGMQQYEDRELPGIILGRYLAESLFIFEPGERVIMWALPKQASILSSMKAREFVVTGICELGFYEYDKVLCYISIESAQQLFKMPGGVSRIDVKLDDYTQADVVAPMIEEKVGNYPFTTTTWFEQNRSLYSWMTIEKRLFTGLLSLIIMVAAFNIISSLIMIVMEKTREIGILKGMGASSGGIMKIFLMEGIIIGVLGVIFGNIIAFALLKAQQKFGFFTMPPEVYIIDRLPVEIHAMDFVVVSIIGLLLCILAAVYPAYKASRLKPVDAIRYE